MPQSSGATRNDNTCKGRVYVLEKVMLNKKKINFTYQPIYLFTNTCIINRLLWETEVSSTSIMEKLITSSNA